jgi:hypothetical protein
MKKFRADVAACLAQPAGKWGGVVKKAVITLDSLAAQVVALTKRVATLEAKH